MLSLILAACSAPSPGVDLHVSNTVCVSPYQNYTYLTCEPLIVSVNGDVFIVPARTETDLASIPRIFWSIMSPAYSQFMGPAIIHDYLYHHNCIYSRYDADLVLYTGLRNNHVSAIRASFMYYMVRAVGWLYYEKGCFDYDRPEEVADWPRGQ